MAPIESLNDGQRAILQLLLRQGKSYDDLAGLLRSDANGVRSRAHEAVQALGPDSPDVGLDRRREIADYLLGQQSPAQRAATREYLKDSAEGRAWARSVAAPLSSVAGAEAMPSIPAEREGVAAAGAEAMPSIPAERAGAAATADAPDPPMAADQGPTRSSQLGGKLIAAGLGLVVAIVVIVVFNPFGGDDDGAKTTGASAPTATAGMPATNGGTARTPSGDRFEVVAQGALKPPAGSDASKATGQIAIVRFPANNQYRLALQAKALPPSSVSQTAYGVWFYTSPRRTRFLGFPDTVVGQDGKLETIADLDPKTPTYREVLVTRERSERPKQPGPIVLRGRLLTAASQQQGQSGQTKTTP
jgi:hypothetical protein